MPGVFFVYLVRVWFFLLPFAGPPAFRRPSGCFGSGDVLPGSALDLPVLGFQSRVLTDLPARDQ
ncbi:uncharacterized protein LOC117192454 isoform X3 [Drosophila miranda]|uniref:uncharacterized protein LOC117192454 isoform X3 n=1 Tax=Drosophila miranda TaxID=7229 RepID=UPI00143F1354|nr:uncharacterized protein LOC117192454 isoform X3 [Drosophila miranda]